MDFRKGEGTGISNTNRLRRSRQRKQSQRRYSAIVTSQPANGSIPARFQPLSATSNIPAWPKTVPPSAAAPVSSVHGPREGFQKGGSTSYMIAVLQQRSMECHYLPDIEDTPETDFEGVTGCRFRMAPVGTEIPSFCRLCWGDGSSAQCPLPIRGSDSNTNPVESVGVNEAPVDDQS